MPLQEAEERIGGPADQGTCPENGSPRLRSGRRGNQSDIRVFINRKPGLRLESGKKDAALLDHPIQKVRCTHPYTFQMPGILSHCN
jgi:hypothetical protein